MALWHGNPADFDGDPRTLSEDDFQLYHWSVITRKKEDGTRDPSTMIYSRATIPYYLMLDADMVVRYDTQTWEAVVVKCRYCVTPCSLEEAEYSFSKLEEQALLVAQNMEVYLKENFVETELGTFFHPKNDD